MLAALIEGFAVCLAPLLPHLAEDIWQFVPYERTHASVFEAGWEGVARHDGPRSDEDKALWAQVRHSRLQCCQPVPPPSPPSLGWAFGGHLLAPPTHATPTT